MRYTPQERACWEQVLSVLKENIHPQLFNEIFRPTELFSVAPTTITLIASDEFSIQHMKTRFFSQLYSAIAQAFGRSLEIEFYTRSELRKNLVPNSNMLLDKYTFDTYVVGPSNELATAASKAVAEMPGTYYNPLFIYGGVGLGKTHLINAIGNAIALDDPTKSIMFITSEQFTNELINTIVKNSGKQELRDRMRGVDVLIVDDVQFMAKSTTMQEEFFHTFNALHAAGKQIVLSSDRPPKEIPTLEERLRSRFEMGLMVDIKKPDLETRIAILKRKIDEMGIEDEFPYEVIEYIATNITDNVRELEGALTKLSAHLDLKGEFIDIDLAKRVLEPHIKHSDPAKLTPEHVMEIVAKEYNLEVYDLTGKKRTAAVSDARQIAMFICREVLGASTPAIGRAFGGRDHTTVMHGCERIQEQMDMSPEFKRRIHDLEDMVKA